MPTSDENVRDDAPVETGAEEATPKTAEAEKPQEATPTGSVQNAE